MYVLSMYTQTHFTQLVPDSAWFICRRLRLRAWLSQAWQGGPFLPKKHFLGKEIKYIPCGPSMICLFVCLFVCLLQG